MADTATPHFGFIQPEPGGSKDTWGEKLNNNWAALDNLLFNSGLTKAAFYGTKADAAGADIDANINLIFTEGFAFSGDGGGAMWVAVASEPSHPGKLQSADGRWWELVSDRPTPEMFGAPTDGVTSALSAILAARTYCLARGVPLYLTCPNGYAIDGVISHTSGTGFAMIGRGDERTTLRALTTNARIEIGRVSRVVLRWINFDGRHPVTEEWTAENFVKLLDRGGEPTGITGASGVTLDHCTAEYTRGPQVYVGRDATETRIIGGRYKKAGRGDSNLSGNDRFLDGFVPIIRWQGNGYIHRAELSGATGYVVLFEGGPSDEFGVFEEPILRMVDCRVQNGFLGLIRAQDYLGDGDRTTAVANGALSYRKPVLVWSSGYLENPGTVQDSTTSGGSPITQGDNDPVYALDFEGGVNVVVDHPVKIQQRRARAAIRARSGVIGKVDLRGTQLLAQQLGDTDVPRIAFDVDAESDLSLAGLPDFRGTRTLLPGDPGYPGTSEMTSGPAYGLTQLVADDSYIAGTGVHVPAAPPLFTLVDGLSTDMIGPLPGFNSSTHGGVVGSGTGPTLPAPVITDEFGPALRVTGRTSAASATILTHSLEIPDEWVGLPLMIEAQCVYQQIGGTWGSVSLALEAFDPAAIDATDRTYRATGLPVGSDLVTHPDQDLVFPVYTITSGFAVPAPGGDGLRSPVYRRRVYVQPQQAGTLAVRFRPRSGSSDAPYHCDYIIRVYPMGDRRATAEPAIPVRHWTTLRTAEAVNFDPLTGAEFASLTPAAGWVRLWDGTSPDPGTPGGQGEGLYVYKSDQTWRFVR